MVNIFLDYVDLRQKFFHLHSVVKQSRKMKLTEVFFMIMNVMLKDVLHHLTSLCDAKYLGMSRSQYEVLRPLMTEHNLLIKIDHQTV